MADAAVQSRPVAALPMAWRIERRTGQGSGDRICRIVSIGGNVAVHFFKERSAVKPSVTVRIGFDNQPRSLRYLRVNRKIFTTAKNVFLGSEAGEIVKQLKLTGEFAFEWAKRPGDVKQHGLFGTGDFAARVEECARWLDGVRA